MRSINWISSLLNQKTQLKRTRGTKLRVENLEDRAVPSGNPPVAISIPRQVVNEDASTLTLNLSGYFSDPEGDTLSYSVVQTNSVGLVTPSINGSTLSLNFAPDQFGFSYLRVTANDGTGTTTTGFEVLVREVSDLTGDTATTSKSTPVTISVLGNDSLVDNRFLAEAANVHVVQNDTGNTTTSVTTTVPQLSGELQLRAGSNRGDYNMQVGAGGADDVVAGMMLAISTQNGRTNAGDTLSGVRYTTPAMDSDASGYYISVNDAPNGGEVNINVAAAYFPYSQGWLGAWGVNSAGTNGGANNTLRNATPNAGFTIGTAATNLVQDLTGGKSRISIPGVSSLTDGLLLANHGKNEDNYALVMPNADGSWQINIRDNGSSGAATEQDPVAFVYVPRNIPNVVSGRLLADGTVAMDSGIFTMSKTRTGTYTLSIPGQSALTGVLMLTPETTTGAGEDNFVTYEASGNDFIIQTRDIVNTTTEPPLENLPGTTPVATFAFIPFLNTPAIRTNTVQSTGGTPNESDLGSTVTINADGTVNYDPSTSTTIQGAAPGSILTDTFTYTTVSLTGQLSTATVTVTVAEGNVVGKAGGVLSIKSTPGIDSNLAISTDGSTFTVTDSATIFSLTQSAIDAGFTGAGTNTLTGPVAGISTIDLDLGNGNDQLANLSGGAAAINATSAGTITPTGTITSSTAVNLIGTTILATSSGLLFAPSVTLNASSSLGTAANPVNTQAETLSVVVGSGDAPADFACGVGVAC